MSKSIHSPIRKITMTLRNFALDLIRQIGQIFYTDLMSSPDSFQCFLTFFFFHIENFSKFHLPPRPTPHLVGWRKKKRVRVGCSEIYCDFLMFLYTVFYVVPIEIWRSFLWEIIQSTCCGTHDLFDLMYYDKKILVVRN